MGDKSKSSRESTRNRGGHCGSTSRAHNFGPIGSQSGSRIGSQFGIGGTLRIDQSPSQLPLNRESKRESNFSGASNDGGTSVDPLLALTASIRREVESAVKSGVNLEVKSNSGEPSSEDSAELTFKL